MQVTAQLFEACPPVAETEPRAGIARETHAALALSTISDPRALEALGTEWSALFEACGRPHQVFQTFEWLSIWASVYLDRRTRLAIVTGRRDGRLVLVWPLVVRRVVGIRILAGMGAPLSQYTDALVAPEIDAASLGAALDHAMSLAVDVVALRRVRDDAVLASLMRSRAGAPSHRQASPYVDFADAPSAAAFEARFSGKLRSSRRRRRRRLEERGTIAFSSHGPTPEAAEIAVAAIAFKRDWARRAGLPAPALLDPRFARFFSAACRAGGRAPALRISALRCGDDIAGIEISVACKGELFGHVLAPNPAFAALGVGGILAESTVVAALEQGFSRIDLLAPADSYKNEWTTTTVGVSDYEISKTLVGALYAKLWLRWGREAAKGLAERLRSMRKRRAPSSAPSAEMR